MNHTRLPNKSPILQSFEIKNTCIFPIRNYNDEEREKTH